MRLHYLQHVPFEGLGMIADWARERGVEVSCTRLYEDDPLPALAEFDLLVVLGGPMSVHDEAALPWMSAEMAFVSRVLESGKPALGICLGAQIFATVKGGVIGRSREREIGWHPIFVQDTGGGNPLAPLLELGEHPVVFHWHGEAFSPFHQALQLASSPGCEVQAFCLAEAPHVLGLQFHIETTPESVRDLITHAAEGELVMGPYIQEPGAMLEQAETACARLRPALYRILDSWSSTAAV